MLPSSRYRSIPIVKALLEADQKSSSDLEDDDDTMNNSPLFLFCALWHSGIKASKAQLDSVSSSNVVRNLYIQNYEGEVKKVKELVEMTCLLLKAAVSRLSKEEEEQPYFKTPLLLPIHASLNIKSFPWTLFYLLVKANPEAARQRDENGDLPIHVMAKSSSTQGHDGDKIRVILNDLCISASIPDRNERLPLHLAIDTKKEYDAGGIDDIFYGAPEAI